MTTATARRRIPTSQILVPIVLGTILVPLAQIALWYLSVHGGSTIIWIGTPLAYYLIGGVGAFATVRGLVPAQARKRGALVGLITGIAGACSAGLLMAVPVVRMFILRQAHLYIHVNAIPRLPVITSVAPPPIPVQLIVAVLLVFFVGINLAGIAAAPLGGMHGSNLRTWFSPLGTTSPEQTGDQGII
ncbi:MAG TPA: hypothetical protein VFX24_03405 [Ktedonobacterales bacterium]|nr:hypothetical protein [Ktedonobacterales bacterium]